MLPDRVSNPGPLTYESGALPIALRGPAVSLSEIRMSLPVVGNEYIQNDLHKKTLYSTCVLTVQSNPQLMPVSCLWLPVKLESPRDVTVATSLSLILATGKPILTNRVSEIKLICCGDVTWCHLQNWLRRNPDLLGFLIIMSPVSVNR